MNEEEKQKIRDEIEFKKYKLKKIDSEYNKHYSMAIVITAAFWPLMIGISYSSDLSILEKASELVWVFLAYLATFYFILQRKFDKLNTKKYDIDEEIGKLYAKLVENPKEVG